jgi:BirA family transcriptional regulator, biotin operon repressor / biotin---[acetyl-CoA-carboxylase] ligase
VADEPFDGWRAAQLLTERGLGLGLPLTVLPVATSTNDLALEAARSGAEHGSAFVAEEQTRGRGRRGRSWVSPPGENLTFSVLLRTRIAPDRASGITLVAGLAVREAVAARVEQPVSVKWPNDVMCRKQKLAGILVESLARGHELAAIVVGIGINVGLELPEALESSATSLGLLGARELDRELLLVDVLAALEPRLGRFHASGLRELLGELGVHDALRGERVRAGELEGRAGGIDASGALRIVSDDGSERLVRSGSVDRVEESSV